MAQTIFALSSGPGPSGVAVFRLSGPGVRMAIQRLTGQDLPEVRKAVLRSFKDPSSGETIDTGLVLFFAGPASFTGEDVAEFHIHGSLATIRYLTATLLAMEGMRAAEAGEFTQRAFRNGKMSLLDVEALSDLLAAETMAQAKLARASVQRLSAQVALWREDILSALALTEASIDFSDEGDVAGDIDSDVQRYIAQLIARLHGAVESFAQAERLRRGFRVALCGPPNAGKSSLMNALARRDVVIVSPIAGTTRDVVEVHFDLGGYPVILADTAGLHSSADSLELEGMERARRAAEAADLILWLSPCDDPQPSPWGSAWVVSSKSDLADRPIVQNRFISVTTGSGVSELLRDIQEEAARAVGSIDEMLVSQERQITELRAAMESLVRAQHIDCDLPELRAEELRQCLHYLDRLIGRIDAEEILGAIFSRFCIGK